MNAPTFHGTTGPVAAAGVSCVVGFDLHTAFGYIGQVVGIVAGLVSIGWVIYQWYKAAQK